jgi:ribosome maturation factor RimP
MEERDEGGVPEMAGREGQRDVVVQVSGLIEPVVEEVGYDLVAVEYLMDRGRWVLRVYIDRDGGVTVDDCARVSREIDHLIEVKDIIRHEYILEVSSPGVNRPLTKEKDFVRAVGKRVKIKTSTPVEGRRNITGQLREYKDGTLHVDHGGTLLSIRAENVKRANLVYEF